MKRYFLLAILIFAVGKLFAQENHRLSLEGDFSYYSGFSGIYTTGKFNHGYSILISDHISKLKISAGVNYSVFDYAEDIPLDNNSFGIAPIRKEYRMEYLNFPILIQPGLYFGEKSKISLLVGVVINQPLRHEVEIFALDPEKNQTIVSHSAVKQGFTLTAGFSISRKLNERFEAYLTPFVNYRTEVGLNGDYLPAYPFVQESNLLYPGVKISLEYLF